MSELIKRIDDAVDLINLTISMQPTFGLQKLQSDRDLLIACRAEIDILHTSNAMLRDHNESLDDECARLEASCDIRLNADELAVRFLDWRLPEDFAPDSGISFVRNVFHDRHGMPTGTNLLHLGQAKAMFEYILTTTKENKP